MAELSADPRVGMIIEDRYRLIARIASGGMGVVYRAERLQLGRAVAIKFLDAANAADETSRARFEREAKAMSLLSHPHCVSVIDFGVADTPYIVMEYVTGQPLLSLIHTKKQVKAERAVAIMKQVTSALAHAHRHDVVHRDIKPANIMLTDATGTGDFVRILDFGLAKLHGASSLSSANIVVGTPSYMSPEQGTGKDLDARSDIYSAGVVLFELVSGEKPFVGEDAFDTLRMHQSDPVPMLSTIRGSDELRVALDAVIQKAMAKKPADRFQTALSMGDALTRIEEASRDLRRPHGKRAVSKRDPARATTQMQAADPPTDGATESEPGGELTREPKSRTKALMILFAFALLTLVAWRMWLAPALDESRKQAAKPIEGLADAAGQPLEATDDAAAPLAAAFDAAVIAASHDAQAADASPTLVVIIDAGAADAPVLIVHEDIDDEDEGPAAVPVGKPTNASEVRALADAGKMDEAVSGLHALIKANPKSGYLHRTMGDLNAKRGWISEAIVNYTRAVRLKPAYKTYQSINETAIDALASSKLRGRASYFIRVELGHGALDHLRAAVRNHKSKVVRDTAARLIKRIK